LPDSEEKSPILFDLRYKQTPSYAKHQEAVAANKEKRKKFIVKARKKAAKKE